MAQASMISAPLKATSEIDWIIPLKTYIRNTYGDDPERYADECATLNRLRQDIRGAGKDTTSGRDMLYRYYAQLELLDLRFPIDEQHIKISFTWFDAFTHKSTSQYSLAFEKASIIFNIAAVLSSHGALQGRSVEAALKMAYHSFQAAAGMFTYINENFLHAPSSDLSRLSVKTLIGIMLAQAQEIFLERQITDQKKVGLLAKLASQAAYLYSQAVEGVQESINKGVFEKVWLLLVQIKWNYMASISQYYQALADEDANNYGIAIARLKVAETSAKDALRGATSFPSSPPEKSNLPAETGAVMAELTKRQLALSQEKLKSLNRDNDFLYHVPVPDEATLAPIPKMPAAKPIPVSELYAGQDIQRITGPDLFAKIVPLAVTEAASLYDEEKAKMVRAESERVDLADGEMAASLDYLRLPGALQVLQGSLGDHDVGPDEDFRTWCDDVLGHDNPATMFESLAKEREMVKGILDKGSKQLDMEESVCEKMRSKYDTDWTQQPSARLTSTLRGDIRSYWEALAEGAKTDAQLSAKLKQNEMELDEMRNAAQSGEVDALFQREVTKLRAKTAAPNAEPNLLDAEFDDEGPSVMDQIAGVKEVLKRLQLIKRERGQVLKDLKEKAHNDDITQILILNKKSIANLEQKLFQQELEKYRQHQNRILQANHKQAHLMRDLTTMYNMLLQDKRVRAEQSKFEAAQRQRTAIINRYKRAYQDFLDLQSGLASARKWYSEMRESVQSLEKNVDSFVNNRRSEGAQLLSQIEKEKQANKASHAEMERERLRELMERMVIDPPPQPSPKLKGRPDPIFAPGGAPRHHAPTSFQGQGQYQTSAQSPPAQASFAPHTYNPAHYGRNPGPTSPPPNQTNFGLRGPSSPPPNQASFPMSAGVTSPTPQFGTTAPPSSQPSYPQSHHQSFPAYAAAAPQHQQQQQAQMMNRPVSVPMPGQQPGAQSPTNGYGAREFVLPPPPTDPPPLWAQQTIHYNSQDYPVDNRLSAENMARMNGGGGVQGAPQQQQQQPQQPAPANHDPWAGLNQWS